MPTFRVKAYLKYVQKLDYIKQYDKNQNDNKKLEHFAHRIFCVIQINEESQKVIASLVIDIKEYYSLCPKESISRIFVPVKLF